MLNTQRSDRSRAAGAEPAARPGAETIDSSGAHVLLANLGFLLVPGPPLDHGAAYLLVAVRPKPTRAHFDPERIEFWTIEDQHSMPATMTWPLAEVDSRFSWGVISVIDRVGAANRFISFGGHLAVSRDREVHAALFRSDAPILSLGGHSELPDPLSGQIAGFMARLRGASGYDSPVRHMAESLSPVALYAAFVSRVVGLYRRPDAAGSVSPHLVSLLRAEQHRVGVEFPADFDAGRKLAELL